jgi:hypothetical protein
VLRSMMSQPLRVWVRTQSCLRHSAIFSHLTLALKAPAYYQSPALRAEFGQLTPRKWLIIEILRVFHTSRMWSKEF